LPSKKPARRVQDIIENAEAILGYTAGTDFAAFQANRQASDATERCLLRISEAAYEVGRPRADAYARSALGSHLRHRQLLAPPKRRHRSAANMGDRTG
jgi:hypothetical protein